MYHSITHEVTAPDALSQVAYRYVILDNLDLTLSEIVHRARATKRHGWKVVKSWDRTNRRGNTMEREEPSGQVREAVRQKAIEAIRFA